MAQFRLEIITPQKLAYDAQVEELYVPTVNGTIGVLPKHEPLFTSLAEGEIKVVAGKKEMFLAIGGGFMEVTKDGVSVLVSRAVNADELNEAEIRKARETAQETIDNRKEGVDIAAAMATLRRSTLELKVLKRAKRRELPNLPE
jgi:F-type H+-transporting ATPase subunit epsilon